MLLGHGYDYKFIMDNALNSLITVGSIELFLCVHLILLNNRKWDSYALGCYALTAWPCRMLFARKGGSSQVYYELCVGLSINGRLNRIIPLCSPLFR